MMINILDLGNPDQIKFEYMFYYIRDTIFTEDDTDIIYIKISCYYKKKRKTRIFENHAKVVV